MSFGVFQRYYTQNPLFKGNKNIPTIGSLATGISNFGFGFVSPIVVKYPQHAHHIMWFGWAICISSLLLASVATEVWHLVLTQGVMYGSGWVMTYSPFLLMLNDWFIARRGLAYGICFSASGIGDLVIPFLLEWLLNAYGFRSTLRCAAAAMILITGPAIILIKPRRCQKASKHVASNDTDLLTNGPFYVFAVAVLLQGSSFYMPGLFLPSFAQSAALSTSQGALLLALIGLAQVFSQLGLGYMSDKVNIHILLFLATGIPAAFSIFVWGSAKTLPPLAAFAFVYSLFASGYSVLWTRLSMYVTNDTAAATTVYGIFSFERGLGTVLAGPISSFLLNDTTALDAYGLGRYSAIVLFVGVTMAGSAFCVLHNAYSVYFKSRDDRYQHGLEDVGLTRLESSIRRVSDASVASFARSSSLNHGVTS